jgi:Uma2 family endonuclease
VAGVREAWLLDLQGEALEVHREPREDGYALVRRYRRGERVAPEALPEVEVAVADLLPPAEAPAGAP